MVVVDAVPADAAAARPIGVIDVPDRRLPAFDRALKNEGGRPPVWKSTGASGTTILHWTFVSVLWGRGVRYVIIGTRLLATIQGAGRPTLWKLGVVGLSGMGIFNFVVIVDTARKLWKFCIRTQMPIQNVRVAKGS